MPLDVVGRHAGGQKQGVILGQWRSRRSELRRDGRGQQRVGHQRLHLAGQDRNHPRILVVQEDRLIAINADLPDVDQARVPRPEAGNQRLPADRVLVEDFQHGADVGLGPAGIWAGRPFARIPDRVGVRLGDHLEVTIDGRASWLTAVPSWPGRPDRAPSRVPAGGAGAAPLAGHHRRPHFLRVQCRTPSRRPPEG